MTRLILMLVGLALLAGVEVARAEVNCPSERYFEELSIQQMMGR